MTKVPREGRLRLWLIPVVVGFLILGGAVFGIVGTRSDSPPHVDTQPQLRRGLRLYKFVNQSELSRLARRALDVIIVKGDATEAQIGRARKRHPHTRLVNYEQAFALNVEEADYARAQGWLATTCSGQEISPLRFPRATLLDATIPSAREWRTDLVAEETQTLGYDLNYLDTLRSYFPADFYDGLPCNVSGSAWLEASLDTVDLVQEKTGKEVIANGNGMQTGLQYILHNEVVDKLIATADAVQVERFGGFRSDHAQDLAFVKAISKKGKDAYVKCRRPGHVCRNILTELVSRSPVYLSVHR